MLEVSKHSTTEDEIKEELDKKKVRIYGRTRQNIEFC